MMSTAIASRRYSNQPMTIVLAALVVLPLIGFASADTPNDFWSYIIVSAAALLPSVLWVWAGSPGIPVFPVVAAIHYVYFAVPILRHNTGFADYQSPEIFDAALTVAIFLLAATAAWGLIFRKKGRSGHIDLERSRLSPKLNFVVFGGLLVGLMFQILFVLDVIQQVGSYFGLIRAILLTATSVSCYLFGYCQGRGILRGSAFVTALFLIGLIVVLSWTSLLLVSSLTNIAAAVLGYVIATKRIPWKFLVTAAALFAVLHAGKGEMRERYWQYGQRNEVPVSEFPELLVGWVVGGVEAIFDRTQKQDLLDRASLLFVLLRAERYTPNEIPYLNGETYALIPRYLVPRFIDPNKPESQAGLRLLDIKYGLQSEAASQFTTIGWGVISEAYANFGYIGIILIGVLYGALGGLFSRLSQGRSALSIPALLAVAALVCMIKVEADLGYLLTNLFQSLIAGAAFFIPLRMLSNSSVDGRRGRTARVAPQLSDRRMPAGLQNGQSSSRVR